MLNGERRSFLFFWWIEKTVQNYSLDKDFTRIFYKKH